MPKGTTTGKQSKATEAEKKEDKKSTSKAKKESVYSKFVKDTVKAAGGVEPKTHKMESEAQEGEKANKKTTIKKSLGKRGKSAEGPKGEATPAKSPLHKVRVSSVKKAGKTTTKKEVQGVAPQGKGASTEKHPISGNNSNDLEAKGDNSKLEEDRTRLRSGRSSQKKGGVKKKLGMKSVSKGKLKERSRSKSIKKDKEEKVAKKGKITPSKIDESEEKPKSTPSKKSSSGKSYSSSKSPRYKEVSGGKIPTFGGSSGTEKRQKKASTVKSKTPVHVSKSPDKVAPGISSRAIKESSSNVESSSSIDLSNEQKKNANKFTYQPENQRINEEVAEVIKKIETRKKIKKDNQLLDKKRKRGLAEDSNKNAVSTAKDFEYILQFNPNVKIKPFIDLKKVSGNVKINNSDVLLSLLEVAHHSDFYNFQYSSKSRCFWNDVIQYKILKKIFTQYKPETLRKYWNQLSLYDSEEIMDIIKKNKTYLDDLPLKLGTIVTSITKFLDKKIKDLKEYIDNIVVDIRKKEIFEHTYLDPVTGDKVIVKETRTTFRKKYEPGHLKNFTNPSYSVMSIKEVYHEGGELNDFQKVMENLKNEDIVKYKYLNNVKDEEKKKLNTINEEDKFVFKAVDNVIDGLSHEFKNFSQEYILELLKQNSMDIAKTYACLKDPVKTKTIGFTSLDDNVLLKHRSGEEYKILLKEKGKDAIQEREEYLKK